MRLKKPNLAFVINSLDPGGAEKLVVEMTVALSGDFNVFVFCLDVPGKWSSDLRQKGVPVYCLWRQPGFDETIPVRLAHYCRKLQIHIIHAHQCTPWFYAALSRLLYAAPRLLLEEHGRPFPEARKRKRIVANRLLIKRLTHRFVAVSEDVRSRLAKYEGLDYDSIEVIYNGIKSEEGLDSAKRIKLRETLGFSPADFVIGTVGRFDPIKNLPLLIRSFAKINPVKPGIRGLLVGDGPTCKAIRDLRDKLGLSETVIMPGYRGDAKSCIQCMDLFVLASFSEGTSIALIEAMQSGVPVAVTNVGGNPEIVLHENTGKIFKSDSVAELYTTMLEAYENPESFRAYGEAGRRRYEEKFTFETMIDSYKKIYCEMLEKARKRL